MRSLLTLPLLIAIAGCAAAELQPPSLAPRTAEAIDPRVPVPEITISQGVSIGLVEQLSRLVAQALAGDEAFRAAADDAQRLAAAAGPPQSESWIVAQQALSAAVAARAPVTRAMGEIDALAAAQIQRTGGIDREDLAAFERAAAQVAEIDAREAALIDRLQERLRG